MSRFTAAAVAAGHNVIFWEDDWLNDRDIYFKFLQPVIFRGSLGNAAHLKKGGLMRAPGAICDVSRFRCSAYYPGAAEFLLNQQWEVMPASVLLARKFHPDELRDAPGIFVRPDSCMKEFAGRLLLKQDLSWKALDRGIYYDEDIPVLVAPACLIREEYRCVVVGAKVIAGCRYDDPARMSPGMPPDVQKFAAEVAAEIEPPEQVYVMDVCTSDRGIRLLELNPFSGADLYACDPAPILAAFEVMLCR